MLTNGQILQGNYRIVGLLGKGGMGSVYEAEHTRLTGRRFAIKENIPEPNADPETLAQLRDQFYVEAKTLASLDHPNLPKVSDYFTQGDNEYLVMDFVEGENLQQIFDRYAAQLRTALPEKSVLTWANQVLDALEYLHGQRPSPIVHRDIKPANIVLTPTGVVKLVDFGLVKLLDQSGQSTAVALRGMGTPAYTALEQYPGTEAHTDARTDIYALGATLYHLLTGQPPANVRDRLLNPKVLEKPRRINPSISAATEAAILKAVEVHPDQRFQSAAQMRAALGGKAAVAHSPAAAPKSPLGCPGGHAGHSVAAGGRGLGLVLWHVPRAAGRLLHAHRRRNHRRRRPNHRLGSRSACGRYQHAAAADANADRDTYRERPPRTQPRQPSSWSRP